MGITQVFYMWNKNMPTVCMVDYPCSRTHPSPAHQTENNKHLWPLWVTFRGHHYGHLSCYEEFPLGVKLLSHLIHGSKGCWIIKVWCYPKGWGVRVNKCWFGVWVRTGQRKLFGCRCGKLNKGLKQTSNIWLTYYFLVWMTICHEIWLQKSHLALMCQIFNFVYSQIIYLLTEKLMNICTELPQNR